MKNKKNTSFTDLINLIAKTSLWENASSGMTINCSDFSDKTLKDAYLFFKKQGINLLIFTTQEKDQKSYLYLSKRDFDIWQESVHLFPTQQNFLMDIQLYNPLTNTDWQYLYDHTHFKTDAVTAIKKTDFLNMLYKTSLRSPLACRVLNEFILLSKTQNLNEQPFSLTIDFTQKAIENLINNKALGMATLQDNAPYIQLKRQPYVSLQTITRTFFHELRHIVQIYLSLNLAHIPHFRYSNNNISYVVARHAIEAEAKAYEKLISKEDKPDVQAIFYHHMDKLLKKCAKTNTLTIPYQQGLTPAQKMAATLKFIHIEAYEHSMQTLCDCLLSKSKLALYHVLNKKGIHLSTQNFNKLAHDVEQWRTYYFSQNLMPIINASQPIVPTYNTNQIEHLWFHQTGLTLNLKATDIFSRSILEQVGLPHLIYTPSTAKKPSYRFIYQGIENTPNNIFKLFRERSYQCIQKIYTTLCQKNPILPTINPNENERCLCYKLVQAIESMQKGKTIQQVLTMLDYNLEDQFTPISFSKDKSTSVLKMQNQAKANERI